MLVALPMLLLACTGPDEATPPSRHGEAGGGGGGGGTGDAEADTDTDTDTDADADADADTDAATDADTDTDADVDSDCLTEPTYLSPSPPTEADICSYMDWDMSPDGWYLVSQFGTSNDSTTWGNETSCYWLQATYDYYECRYDSGAGECLDDDDQIDWIQGHVDYDYDEVIDTVAASAPDDVDFAEAFYVAGAQRFHCGTTLRVSNPVNGRCVVVYAEDGGPNATYETAAYAGRRILDSSPAVIEFLEVDKHGWSSSQLLYVELGLAGDVPGDACATCQGEPAQQGNESLRSPWDPDHMTGIDCP